MAMTWDDLNKRIPKYIWCPECGEGDTEPLQPLTVWTADAPDVQDVFAPSIEEVLTMYHCPVCLLTFSIHGDKP